MIRPGQAFQNVLRRGHVFLRAVTEHVLRPLSRQVAVCEPAAREHAPQGLQIGFASVQRLPAGGHGRRHVFGPLHPALDLQGTDARIGQILHVRNIAHILQRQRVILAPDLPVQAAGLRAEAPVAGASAEHRGHVAVAGYAHAVRSVHEHFAVRAGLVDDRPDLLQGQFSRQHHADKAVVQQFAHAFGAADRHLRGRVQRQFRPAALRVRSDRQILHDDRVSAAARSRIHSPVHGFEFVVHHERIDGHVDLDPRIVAVAYRVLQPFPGKIVRVAARVEIGQAEVHRVASAAHGGFQLFGSAHRGEDFRFSVIRFRHDKTLPQDIP